MSVRRYESGKLVHSNESGWSPRTSWSEKPVKPVVMEVAAQPIVRSAGRFAVQKSKYHLDDMEVGEVRTIQALEGVPVFVLQRRIAVVANAQKRRIGKVFATHALANGVEIRRKA